MAGRDVMPASAVIEAWRWPVVHPEKVLSPVLLVRGEHDGIATIADLEESYNKLPNGDRQFIILPGTTHSASGPYQDAA
jgi:pimeloyl-ACP methyl ester carboxylesterase